MIGQREEGVLDPEGMHIGALLALCDFTGARVCEVGCGDGRLTVEVARNAASVFAFDPEESAVARARMLLPPELDGVVEYRVGSATEIEIPRAGFDIVVFSWSL